MSRKALFGAMGHRDTRSTEAPAPVPSRVRARPILGSPDLIADAAATPVGAIGQSLGEVSERARRAEEIERKLTAGQVIVEIETALVDPSFVSDRMPVSDRALASLTEKIRDHGPLNPILVRPHPESKGRYQIAYGNRRHAVCHELQRPVRAVVKDLTDAEMVVAQGQENAARKDLTFIEQARFVANLKKVHPALEIEREFGINESLVHKMVAIVRELPEELIQTIGRADRIGRPRWDKLREAVEELKKVKSEAEIVAEAKAAVGAARARTDELKPHMRFEAVFEIFVSGKPKEVVDLSAEGGESLGKVVRTATGSNLKLNDPAFVDHLLEMLPELHRLYREKRGAAAASMQAAAE